MRVARARAAGGADADEQQIAGLEAEINLHHRRGSARQSGASQQHHREGQLQNHQCTRQTRPTLCDTLLTGLQPWQRVLLPDAKRRRHRERHRSDRREEHRVRHDTPIGSHVHSALTQWRRRQQLRNRSGPPTPSSHTRPPGEQRDRQPFGEQQSDDPQSRGTE